MRPAHTPLAWVRLGITQTFSWLLVAAVVAAPLAAVAVVAVGMYPCQVKI